MPRVNLYIKNEDWKAFQSIENKPEWLHNAIHNKDVSIHTPKPSVSIHTSEESKDSKPLIVEDDYDEFASSANLIVDPTNKNRAYDPELEDYVPVIYKNGRLLRND